MKKLRYSLIIPAAVLMLSLIAITASGAETFKNPAGYESSNIAAPGDIVTNRTELLNAINYNLTQMKSEFTIVIEDFDKSKLPRLSEVESGFVQKISYSKTLIPDGNKATVSFKITFNDAGKVVLSNLYQSPIASSETKALELEKVCEQILADVEGKSDYEKIVYMHDYVVGNCDYDSQDFKSTTPYNVLVENKGIAKGYASALQLLYTLSGIENRVVSADSAFNNGSVDHYFNKVKLDGDWYNVDATVDDPKPDIDQRIKRDYLLVTDDVSHQRYIWEDLRYPAAETNNNWHHRNGLTASSQEELEKLVKEAISRGDNYFSVWIEDFSPEKYKVGFANELENVESCTASTTPATADQKTYATAIFFVFEYK